MFGDAFAITDLVTKMFLLIFLVLYMQNRYMVPPLIKIFELVPPYE